MTRLGELARNSDVQKQFPALLTAVNNIASPQMLSMGTVGGELCQRPRCWYFRLEEVICLKKGGSQCYAATGENKYNAILGGGPSHFPERRLLRGQGRPDVGLFGDRAMAAGNRSAGDAVFPQDLTHGDGAFRTVDRTAG